MLCRPSHAGQADQQHKANNQQHANGKDAQRRVAGQRGDDRHQEGAHNACITTKDVKEAVVLVGLFLGDNATKVATAERLHAALEQADHNGKPPEFEGGL